MYVWSENISPPIVQNTEQRKIEDIIKYWGYKVGLQVQESEHTNIEDIIKYCQILCVQA